MDAVDFDFPNVEQYENGDRTTVKASVHNINKKNNKTWSPKTSTPQSKPKREKANNIQNKAQTLKVEDIKVQLPRSESGAGLMSMLDADGDGVLDKKELDRFIKQEWARCSNPEQKEKKEAYRVIEKLGEGGFGAAYRVVHKQSRKEYVLKWIHCESDEQAGHTVEEMVAVRLCEHPFVIRYQEFFQDGKDVFFVMEFAGEGDVERRIDACRNSPGRVLKQEQVLRWFCQVAIGLEHIHQMGFVHRDIKPANVFLTRWDVAKLGDFGLASLSQASSDSIAGTRGFMAPETLTGQQTSHKSDVWALGCLLYEMITCHSAYVDLYDETNDCVPCDLDFSIIEENRHYDKGIYDLLHRILIHDPKHRPSMTTLLKDPFLKPWVEKIISEEALLRRVMALEDRIGYDQTDRVSKRQSRLEQPSNLILYYIWFAVAAFSTIVVEQGGAFVDSAKWFFFTLLNPKRLQNTRNFVDVLGGPQRAVIASNMICWLPLVLLAGGYFLGALIHLISIHGRLFILALVCPLVSTKLAVSREKQYRRGTATKKAEDGQHPEQIANLPLRWSWLGDASSFLGGVAATLEAVFVASQFGLVFGTFIFCLVLISGCSLAIYIAMVGKSVGLRVRTSTSWALHCAGGVCLGIWMGNTLYFQPLLSSEESIEVSAISLAQIPLVVLLFVIAPPVIFACNYLVEQDFVQEAIKGIAVASTSKYRPISSKSDAASKGAGSGGRIGRKNKATGEDKKKEQTTHACSSDAQVLCTVLEKFAFRALPATASTLFLTLLFYVLAVLGFLGQDVHTSISFTSLIALPWFVTNATLAFAIAPDVLPDIDDTEATKITKRLKTFLPYVRAVVLPIIGLFIISFLAGWSALISF